jgi:hypothetical protein
VILCKSCRIPLRGSDHSIVYKNVFCESCKSSTEQADSSGTHEARSNDHQDSP